MMNCRKAFLFVALKKALFLLGLILFLFSAFVFFDNRLPVFEARMVWPQKPFDEVTFRGGNPDVRASMAADLIAKEKYVGSECKKIPEFLGAPNGDYYHQDTNHTYLLTDKPSANWVLTFVCGDQGRVDFVFVRKGCCSASQQLLFWGLELIEPLARPSR